MVEATFRGFRGYPRGSGPAFPLDTGIEVMLPVSMCALKPQPPASVAYATASPLWY